MLKIKVPTPKVRGQNWVSAITQKLLKQRTRVNKGVFLAPCPKLVLLCQIIVLSFRIRITGVIL